jgi:plasmid stability protein
VRQILIRNLDAQTESRLRLRARLNGRSIEAEVREILRAAVRNDESSVRGLGTEIAELFSGIGLTGEIPELRGELVKPVEFEP